MISIAVINYKTIEITLNTIKSIVEMTDKVPFELIVIDNASGKLEADALSQKCSELFSKALGNKLKVILNPTNLGFACANNQAMRLAEGDYIALLNSDTELTTDSFSMAVAYLEQHPDVGAVSCRLITPDGCLDHGCKRGFPTPSASLIYFSKLSQIMNKPELDQYRLSYLDEHQIHDVDAISGAFMVMRKEVVDQVNLFDERFFMYGEDLDLCYRIKEAGWRIVYNPELGNVIHYKGSSAKKRKFKTLFNFYEAMFLFYNKHYVKKYNPIVTILVYIGIVFQFIVKLIRNYLFLK